MKIQYHFIYTVLACLIASVLLFNIMLPELWSGFLSDDYFWWAAKHNSQITNNELRSFFDYDLSWALTRGFMFFDGDPKRTAKLVDLGLAPWWTASDLKVSFFRPLSAFTHWLDFEMWADRPDLMHIHNLLWLVTFLTALGLFFSKFFLNSTWLFPLLAVTFCRPLFFTSRWILGRNLLIAGTFCFLALYFYISAIRNNSKTLAVAAITSLILSLLSHESGILAFILAAFYTAILDTRPLATRIKSILPFFIISTVWLICYRLLGYGILNSGVYIDILSEPYQFLLAVQYHVKAIFPSPTANLPAFIYLCCLSLLVIFLILKRSRETTFWLASLLCVFLITCCGPSHERLNLLYYIFFIGLSWQIFALLKKACSKQLGKSAGILVYTLSIFLFIIIFSTERVRARSISPNTPSPVLNESILMAKEKNMIILGMPAILLTFLNFKLTYYNLPLPKSLFAMLPPAQHYSLTHESANSIIVKNNEGLFKTDREDFFRPASFPFKLGEEIRLSNVTIKILEIDSAGMPKQIKYDFSTPIFSADNILFIFEEGKYKQITPVTLSEIRSLSWK